MTDPAKRHTSLRYGRFAAGYVTSPTHAKGPDLERLVAVARARPDWHVLDVATGGGHTALAFAPLVRRVMALDLTRPMLMAARDHARARGAQNIAFCQADAETLPLAAGSLDLVVCRIAPHHFPRPDAFVAESARVLAPGGVFLVQDTVVPTDPADARYVESLERLRDPSHVRALPKPEWAGLLRSAGLTIELEEDVVKRHRLVEWAVRQGATSATIETLQGMLRDAPPGPRDWLLPEGVGTEGASFVIHQVLLAGRKAGAPPSDTMR